MYAKFTSYIMGIKKILKQLEKEKIMPEEIMNEEVVETATEAVAEFGLKEVGIVGGVIAVATAATIGIVKFVVPRAKTAWKNHKENRKEKDYVEVEIVE